MPEHFHTPKKAVTPADGKKLASAPLPSWAQPVIQASGVITAFAPKQAVICFLAADQGEFARATLNIAEAENIVLALQQAIEKAREIPT